MRLPPRRLHRRPALRPVPPRPRRLQDQLAVADRLERSEETGDPGEYENDRNISAPQTESSVEAEHPVKTPRAEPAIVISQEIEDHLVFCADNDYEESDEHTWSVEVASAVRKREHEQEYSVPQFRSRAETKQLYTYTPWRLIPHEHRPKYRQALETERETWKKLEAVRILNLEESRQVEQRTWPESIIASRVCYNDKNATKLNVEVEGKARLVGIEFRAGNITSPDGAPLRRDSPTVQRISVMIMIQIVASKNWDAWGADASTAFLQGDNGEES